MKRRQLVLYVCGLSLIMACGDSETETNKVSSDLQVEETPYKGFFHFDASGSTAESPYSITEQSLTVTDDSDNPVLSHSFEQGKGHKRQFIEPGTYTATLLTTASDPEGHLKYDRYRHSFKSDTDVYSLAVGDCTLSCSFSDDDNDILSCIPSSTSTDAQCNSLSLSTVVDTIQDQITTNVTDDTVLWLRAYGAMGGTNSSKSKRRGHGGFAQTITTVTDFSTNYNTDTLIFLTGDEGSSSSPLGAGSATIVAADGAITNASSNAALDLSKTLLIAGGGGAGDKDKGGQGGHAASMITGLCALKAGNNSAGDDVGYQGGTTVDDQTMVNDDTYCTDTDNLLKLAVGGSTSGQDGAGGIGGYDVGWSNNTSVTSAWGGAGNGGNNGGKATKCSGGGGFGGGGSCSGTDRGGGGGGSFAVAPTTVDFDAYDSDSENSGDGYIALVFNLAPNPNEGYCDVSCAGYGDKDSNGNYAQAKCSIVDMSYDTHECNQISLSYVIDTLNDSGVLNEEVTSTSTIWLRAYGGNGRGGDDNSIAGDPGKGGRGGAAQTLLTLDAYQKAYGTDNLYFLLGNSSSDHGGSGAATLILTAPALYQTDIDVGNTLLVAGGGGGGGNQTGTSNGGNGGDGGIAASYVTGICSVTQGADAQYDDGGDGGGTTLSSLATQYCDVTDSDNASVILSLASAGQGKENDGKAGIGGLGGNHSGSATSLWTSNADLSANWIGSGNGGRGQKGPSSGGASGAGGGGFGGGGGGHSQGSKRGVGGGGGGSYAASPLTTDYAACDTTQDDCGLSTNGSAGYIEFIINIDPQTTDPDGS